jgi:hypothetical protein
MKMLTKLMSVTAMILCVIIAAAIITPLSMQILSAGSASTLSGYSALIQYTAFGEVQTKTAWYQGLKTEIGQLTAREDVEFGRLRNQRLELKQQIDQFNATHKNNIQRLKAIAQQRKAEAVAALNALYAINPATKTLKDQQLAGIDKAVNEAIAKLDATTGGDFLPKPITD